MLAGGQTNVTATFSRDIDLIATKTNNVGGTIAQGGNFTWTIVGKNQGTSTAAASFGNTQTILTDGLPSVVGVTYGAVSVATSGTTGAIACAITGGVNLACTAGVGGFTMPANATFTVSIPVSANPLNPTTLTNPRVGSICRIDSSSLVTESNETNNDCADTVSVTTDNDLIATKTNNVSGTIAQGGSFTWTIVSKNLGTSTAIFGNTQTILTDGLPSVVGVTYGAVGVATSGTTGSVSCAITGGVNLACTAGVGGFTMPANGTFTVTIPVSANPANPVTLANPRVGSVCRIDSSSLVTETNESNNDCSDSVASPPMRTSLLPRRTTSAELSTKAAASPGRSSPRTRAPRPPCSATRSRYS